MMKKIAVFAALVVAIALAAYLQRTPQHAASPVDAAFDNHSSGVEVEGAGKVTAILPDDTEGSPHQRFIVRLDSGRTVLIAHNVDVAPRVTALRAGDTISFRGEYVWNPKGGLIHWTHRDATGHHEAGWLEHNGQTFQ